MIRFLLFALACITSVSAFSPRSPDRHVVARGEFFVVIDSYGDSEEVTAFQASNDGFKQLWQSNGWFGYPEEVFLAPDGMSLVRIARFPNTLDGKKLEKQSVLFLYFKGKQAKDYKLSDIVRDMGSIEDLGSFGGLGSRWMDEAEIVQSDWHGIDTDRKDERLDEQTLRSYNHFAFRLKTLEGDELFFGLLNGKCIARRKSEVVEATKENGEATGDPFENQNSEQNGADQPATAPEPEGDKTTNPESEGRSQ